MSELKEMPLVELSAKDLPAYLPEPGHAALEHASARLHRRHARRSALPVLQHALQAERRRSDQGSLSLACARRRFVATASLAARSADAA